MNKAPTSKEYVYVLELKENKFYVGLSTDPDRRFAWHFTGKSPWTARYEPKCILKTFEKKYKFQEDSVTLEYMQMFGIDNVRGGSYTTMELSDSERKEIIKKFDTETGACFHCHTTGHFASKCLKRSSVHESKKV